jgi:hypothetical protein
MANRAKITRPICRKVILDKQPLIGCKSAKMFIRASCRLGCRRGLRNSIAEALFHPSIFMQKGIEEIFSDVLLISAQHN